MFIWVPNKNVQTDTRYGQVVNWLIKECVGQTLSEIQKASFHVAEITIRPDGSCGVRFDDAVVLAIEPSKPRDDMGAGHEIFMTMKEIKDATTIKPDGVDVAPQFAVMRFSGDWWLLVVDCDDACCLYKNYHAIIDSFPVVKVAGKKVEDRTEYNVLIKWHDAFFLIGRIEIKTHKGDIYFYPSGNPKTRVNSKDKQIDHVSWHKTGRTHMRFQEKSRSDRYDVVDQNEGRLGFDDVGFQEMMTDTIKDFTLLPLYEDTPSDLDVVFDSTQYCGPVAFHFSIVSGQIIVAHHEGVTVPVRPVSLEQDEKRIDSTRRALGWHSGFGDILLQYSLHIVDVSIQKTNRHMFLPKDMNIRKTIGQSEAQPEGSDLDG